ncbi:MAG: hypothetical protein NT007_14795 [Candidatus Kapabacteria bacterium]|nr:hypothetical protein [Candidatus Kapabacteria bacterium]
MKQILSIFFNSDRTYLSIVEPTRKGLKLVDIFATNQSVNFQLADDSEVFVAAAEIEAILGETQREIEEINIVFPTDQAMLRQLPSQQGLSNNEIIKLVKLEIKQEYPNINFDEFSAYVTPFKPLANEPEKILATIIPKNDISIAKKLLENLHLPINRIEVSQLSAHKAFLYNYPESAEQIVAFLAVQKQFIDVSLISKGELIYYNLVAYNNEKQIGEICEIEFNKLLMGHVSWIDFVYFFGSGLNKNILNYGNEALVNLGLFSGRLNPFRMFSTNLDERVRQYCDRTAHIYAPCIGSCIPDYHPTIKLV